MIIHPIVPIVIMLIICGILTFLARTKDKFSYIRRIAIIILLFIVNLRIMVKSNNVTVMNNNLDVLFVIDTTISMMAEDYDENVARLEAVKVDCNHIIEELGGAKYALITFNNESQIAMPYTTDTNTIIQYLDIIQVMDEIYAKGSSLNTPIENMEYLLKSSLKKEGRNRIVFFISDGEITNDEKIKSYKSLQEYIANGAVLGYGTESGGKMKIFDKYLNTEVYVEDRTSEKFPYPYAVSKKDEKNLKQIADDLDIDYIYMDRQSNIDKKIEEIKNEYLVNDQESIEDNYTDIYYIFVIPILILLLYELVVYKKHGII